MNSDDDQEDSTDSVNEIMETGKPILLLGISTVDVEGTVKTKGSRNITDECLTTTARNCVIKNIISINDGRDLARLNSIRCYDKSNVYPVSLVNTTSNPTVYDTNRHLNADYNCRQFLTSLDLLLSVGNQKIQIQEMTVEYYYMPAVSSNLSKLFAF